MNYYFFELFEKEVKRVGSSLAALVITLSFSFDISNYI